MLFSKLFPLCNLFFYFCQLPIVIPAWNNRRSTLLRLRTEMQLDLPPRPELWGQRRNPQILPVFTPFSQGVKVHTGDDRPTPLPVLALVG